VKNTFVELFVQFVVNVAGVLSLSGAVLFVNGSYPGNVIVPELGVSAVHVCVTFAVIVTLADCEPVAEAGPALSARAPTTTSARRYLVIPVLV